MYGESTTTRIEPTKEAHELAKSLFSRNLKRDNSKTTAQQAIKKNENKKPKAQRNYGNQTSFKVYNEEIIEKLET